MEITEETITLGFTQSLGNYEFLRADIALRAKLGPGDTLDDVHDKLYAAVEQRLVDSAREIHGSLSKDAKRKTKIDPE
jgi:hypothetical protein